MTQVPSKPNALVEEVLSTVSGDVLSGLRKADRLWESYKTGNLPVKAVVQDSSDPIETVDWDVVVCGGTLGIMIGATLAIQGWRVALVERGILRGRDQEWNISRQELQELVDLDLLTPDELEMAIATEYNPARISFTGGKDIWVNDVLNIGVDPVCLLEILKQKFLAAGGTLLEHTGFVNATVHPNGLTVTTNQSSPRPEREADSTGSTEKELTTRLLLDVMGHFSPIARQARNGQSPDAVCMVVGTCAQGYPKNDTGDLFASFTPVQRQCQYFWEAFPARDGRTTYMFTYLDAHPDRPSLEEFFGDYLTLLPDYQGITLDQLQIQRALFGFFPCYQDSPLRSPWSRILFVGDSSGIQSPLSFGGFGAMIRHLPRLTAGLQEALSIDRLDQESLALLQPYQPNVSVTWMFQRSMSVGVNQTIDPNQINALLSVVFQQMEQLGDEVLKPFLQDVIQFPALLQTLFWTGLAHPLLIARIIPQVGLGAMLDWMVHYANLGVYTGLAGLASGLGDWGDRLPPAARYRFHRYQEAWRYGSGGDYTRAND